MGSIEGSRGRGRCRDRDRIMDRDRNMDRDRDRVRIGIGTEIGICTYCLIYLFLYPFFEVSLCFVSGLQHFILIC